MSGTDIITARTRKHLSKHDLARLSGYSYQHIHNLEAGHKPITLDVARRLDRVLRFPIHVLVSLIRLEARMRGSLGRISAVLLGSLLL